jgi:SNF2 family DNA or RNA helicase
MEIVQDKALRLKLRTPARVTNTIPKAKQLPDGSVLVNWGLEEVQVLRNLGINAPSPITARYNWPGRYTPYEHQKTTAEFLTLNRRAFCFNQQGTGKSAAAIWAADYLMNLGLIKRVLIICPVSVIESTWRADLFTVAMHRTVAVAHGTAAKRRQMLAMNTEFVIINTDGITVVEDELRAAQFDLIIADEATSFKNVSTNRWKSLHSLVLPKTWLWLMTGTPAAQSPLDAYGLAKLVNPTGVPRSLTQFKDMVMYKITQFKWVARPQAGTIVHSVLKPAIRFTKEECLDLPELVYTHRDVPLSKQQDKYYKLLKDKMRIQAAGEEVTAANAAVAVNKLLQVSAGALYTDTKEVLEFDITPRYSVLKEVLEETDNKTLIFVPFTHAIDMLTALLRKDGYDVGVIRGDVSASKRGELISQFQNTASPRVMIIQPQAAAHGVTLTKADTIVWWGPTSSLELYEQANARIHRAGQVNHCTVVHLQGSPAEKHYYKMLDQRIDVHSKFIELYSSLLD